MIDGDDTVYQQQHNKDGKEDLCCAVFDVKDPVGCVSSRGVSFWRASFFFRFFWWFAESRKTRSRSQQTVL